MASKYTAPPFTMNMTEDFHRRFSQYAHNTEKFCGTYIHRGTLARIGIEEIMKTKTPEQLIELAMFYKDN